MITICKQTVEQPEKEKIFVKYFSLWTAFDKLSEEFSSEWGDFMDSQEAKNLVHAFLLSKKINDLIAPVLNLILEEVSTQIDAEANEKNLEFLRKHEGILGISSEYFTDICNSLTIYSEAIKEIYDKDCIYYRRKSLS